MVRAGLLAILAVVLVLSSGVSAALAQSPPGAWVQIEAHPDLQTAQDRARAYGVALSDVNGFRLRSGWYALTLGPYGSEAAATARLRELRGAGLIPGDSYISDGRPYGRQFWPIGGAATGAAPNPTPGIIIQPNQQDAVQPSPPPAELFDETPEEARRNERLLTRFERQELQEALKWYGFYAAAIDGSFGPGTRRSMAEWQATNSVEVTGILTTGQRRSLLQDYRQAVAALDLTPVEDDVTGIALTLPAGLVEFDRYEPPFAHYRPKSDSGVRVLLISQPGDETTLGGLYEIMQTLEIVPFEGARERKRRSFVLTGQNETLHSYTYARTDNQTVKGFTIAFPPARALEMANVIQIMRDSFTTRDGVLAPNPADEQSVDLVAGLEIRRPKTSRSGFFVDPEGRVLTHSSAVQSCQRITLDSLYEAEISVAQDGLALLTPVEDLAPLDYARFSTKPARLRSEVAVSGYSFEGTLSGPTVTYGQLEDLRGLVGDQDIQRLSVDSLSGDTGGPVFDMTGAVTGLLMPLPETGRALPKDTKFATKADQVARFLSENGVTASASERQEPIDPEDLIELASAMTVLVSCW
ncbi:serine protease [Litoreibacter roseus]|uniref:Peptidoglycan-binding protein n=1 Tax=Litoreibacter roseus TaxID=2601869 RepID=A0A6N6JJE2_9RHOB|nr:peptidoglycan-binding protein [Litoreibacter roseus]GFE65950.1 peptidoglycan-binding protein [Litoreibacter roseus]